MVGVLERRRVIHPKGAWRPDANQGVGGVRHVYHMILFEERLNRADDVVHHRAEIVFRPGRRASQILRSLERVASAWTI